MSRFALFGALVLCVPAPAQTFIGIDSHASPQETFAGREVMRYVYLRTGRLFHISSRKSGPGLFVVRKDHLPAATNKVTRAEVASLGPQEYLLTSLGSARLLIVGGDETGVLYGAYRFAEHLGVRFYLHGDTIPDQRIPFRIPKLHEIGRPIFALRGINPFHDFPEGPDWWNRDDYLAYIGQLPKLRMNFIGLHTYPEGGVGPEPEVWIGQQSDLEPDGRVKFSYPSSWASTLRPGSWGYDGGKTSQFSSGASQLFASDDFGPAVMRGMMPKPVDPATSNRLFSQAGAMFHDAFAEARALGVKTCVGTETPLTIPKLVQDRLRAQGKDPGSPEVIRSVYAGMFTRIARLFPVDYYWLWTPEDWTWGGNTPEQLKRTTDDLQAALSALDSIGSPFRLATCGWVLGPQNDRAALDRLLPKNVAVSTINQSVGNSPVEPGFGKITGRSKWAIPWMENDPALTAPELWASRMLYDAADAKRLGCDGLFGIHWRTKILSPNVSALALAAWDQSWKPAGFDGAAATLTSNRLAATGAEGGNMAQFTEPVTGTDEQPVYQTVRYNMEGYDITAPNGAYTVTLKFNEPAYSQSGKRVFGVKLQGRTVVDRLDMFARVGQNHALDFTFNDVGVQDGHLRIDFIKEVEFPCIAGIVVTGSGFSRKINCGGNRYKDYIGELDSRPNPDPEARSVPVGWFYEDFARANFGDSVGQQAGAIFSKIDGMNLPRPATWITGPGDIAANQTTWDEVAKSYWFVDAFALLRPNVRGSGNLDRFDYWLNTFQYMREMGRAGCLRGQLDLAMKAISAESDPARTRHLAEESLKTRIQLARTWERLMGYIEATVSTPGELGTISNLEQHARQHARLLSGHDAALTQALGRPLPPSIEPTMVYQGPSRIIVPTVRTSAAPGERLTLDVILPSTGVVAKAALHWRRMGVGAYSAVPLSHVGRSVYRVTLPAVPTITQAIEYYIEAEYVESNARRRLMFPATAPAINQTVVVTSLVP
ncbi:MAG: malectin domain-containing carbohydrate-binding protein [Fimbriimonadales bacterium]